MVRRAFLIRKIMGSNPIIPKFAAMVKLVYTLVLGADSGMIKGSTPFCSKKK